MAEESLYVLCVDDDEECLEFLALAARSAGFVPIATSKIDEAIRVIEDQYGQLVLAISDFMLEQERTALDIRRQTMKYVDLPFLITSGYVSREVALESLECKVDGFLEKPIELERLVPQIKSLAARRVEEIEFKRSLKKTFLAEAESLLEDLEGDLIAFDSNPSDSGPLNAVFRQVHTIKGSSSVLDTQAVRQYAHQFEDFLTQLRQSGRIATAGDLATCFRALDTLKALILSCQRGEEPENAPQFQVINDQQLESDPKAAVTSQLDQGNKQMTSKVAVEVLDHLEYLAAEVTIQRNMLSKLVGSIVRQQPENPDVLAFVSSFDEMTKFQSLMQEEIKKVRTTPFGELVRPLSRIVRDLEKQLGKKTRLTISGGELGLDHRSQKILSDCMIHLLRNCMDHGIEVAHERSKTGKPALSEISLELKESSHYLRFEMKDDGRGINPEKVKAQAIERKMLTAKQAGEMSDAQVINLIFEPGFSTAENVTDVSGRGVGMDMVRTSLAAIGGQVEVRSVVGEGTSVILSIPKQDLSVSIDALLVRAKDQYYAIPQHRIVRMYVVDSADRRVIEQESSCFWEHDGHLIPLLSLPTLLGFEDSLNSHESPLQIVVVRTQAGIDLALKVDEINDLEELVIRLLADITNETGLFRGAALLNDGTVGLVIDLDGLANFVGLSAQGSMQQVADDRKSAQASESEHSHELLLGYDRDWGYLALPQSIIYRIELVDRTQYEQMNGKPVIRYRQQIVPIRRLTSLLARQHQLESLDHSRQEKLYSAHHDKDVDFASQASLVLINDQDRYQAFELDQVVDLVEISQSSIMPAMLDDEKIGGHFVHQEQLYSLIDLKPVLAKPAKSEKGFKSSPEKSKVVAFEQKLQPDKEENQVQQDLAKAGWGMF